MRMRKQEKAWKTASDDRPNWQTKNSPMKKLSNVNSFIITFAVFYVFIFALEIWILCHEFIVAQTTVVSFDDKGHNKHTCVFISNLNKLRIYGRREMTKTVFHLRSVRVIRNCHECEKFILLVKQLKIRSWQFV